jgi:hypothetical protein
MKKIISLVTVFSLSLFALQMPPMPPFGMKQKQHNTLPQSCKVIPPMLRHLPPPMEIDFELCRNDLNIPSLNSVYLYLNKYISKKAILKHIQVLSDFNQLYKVTYLLNQTEKTIFCNKTATKCISGELILKMKFRKK